MSNGSFTFLIEYTRAILKRLIYKHHYLVLSSSAIKCPHCTVRLPSLTILKSGYSKSEVETLILMMQGNLVIITGVTF